MKRVTFSVQPLILGTAVFVLCGCRAGKIERPGDAAGAQAVLRQSLTAWQAGKTSIDLQKTKPSVLVSDEDWLAGRKLESFELADRVQPHGSHWRVFVTLKLGPIDADSQFPAEPVEACYAVSLGRTTSIIRSDFLN